MCPVTELECRFNPRDNYRNVCDTRESWLNLRNGHCQFLGRLHTISVKKAYVSVVYTHARKILSTTVPRLP
jgi:hypothetical protein